MNDRSVSAPTYEELAALVAAQERTIAQLQAQIIAQDAEIAELKRRLAASSHNSSKPPSSDGLDKPAPKSLRGRSGRKPGGQPGREGRTLRQVEKPNEVVVHEPGGCAGCGAELPAADPPARIIRRQVFDIPTIEVRVVEHRLISRRCSCGVVTAAAAPAGVSAPAARAGRLARQPPGPAEPCSPIPLLSRVRQGGGVLPGAGRLAGLQAAALACVIVEERVFVVYASFGSGAEPQVIGVASSATRAEELADQFAEEDRCAWRRPDWLQWDSARRVRPAVDRRGNAVEVWLVEAGLDQLIRFTLEIEPLTEEHD